MTLSAEARKYMDMRDDMPNKEQWAIDEIWPEVHRICEMYNVPLALNDIAAEFEAAMIKFIIESREG